MNKIIYPLMVMAFVTGCSSTPKSVTEDQNQAIVNHLAKGKQIIGKDFEEKFTKEGLINGDYVAIGSYETNQLQNVKHFAQLRAEEDSKNKLFNTAPTEYKKIVQSAISTVNGSIEAEKVSISVTEVQALTGLTSGFNDSQCVQYANPTQDLKYEYSYECRAITRVPASNLMKAYKYTLDKKYSVREDNSIKEMLKQQLMEKVLDKPQASVQNINSSTLAQ